MSILDEICDVKRKHVAAQELKLPFDEVRARLTDAPKPLGFINAIQTQTSNDHAIIAEIKKASPSKGLIREDFDPVKIAQIYRDNGAACISILTDTPYFQGSDQYFSDVRNAVDIPLLRKDFMVASYQIFELRMLGADCVLLIMAALNDEQAREFYDIATELGMDVLVEVHNEEELERAKALKPRMIGVNNRNLQTMHVDIQTSYDFVSKIPDGVVKIAESGLSKRSDIQGLNVAGYNGFLIGESLMREENIGAALRNII